MVLEKIREIVVPHIGPPPTKIFKPAEWKIYRDTTVRQIDDVLEGIETQIEGGVMKGYLTDAEATELRGGYSRIVGEKDLYKRKATKADAESHGKRLLDKAYGLYKNARDAYEVGGKKREKEINERASREERETYRREQTNAWNNMQVFVKGASDTLKAGLGVPTGAMEAISQAHRTATSTFAPAERRVVVVEKPPEEAIPELKKELEVEEVGWTDKIVAYAKEKPLRFAGMVILGAVTARIAVPLVAGAIAGARGARAKKYAFKGA